MLARGEVHDPVLEGHLITVPEVRMTADLRLATVYVMPLGGRDQDEVLAALERNKRFLRGEIARRVNLKFAPDIRFRIDERFDEAERIEKLLRTPAVQRDLDKPTTETNDDERIDAINADAAARGRAAAAAQAREARRARLARARQAGRHDVDARGERGRSALYRPSAPATPARSIRWPPACSRSRSGKRPRPCRS